LVPVLLVCAEDGAEGRAHAGRVVSVCLPAERAAVPLAELRDARRAAGGRCPPESRFNRGSKPVPPSPPPQFQVGERAALGTSLLFYYCSYACARWASASPSRTARCGLARLTGATETATATATATATTTITTAAAAAAAAAAAV
jgi:hypothetical protein